MAKPARRHYTVGHHLRIIEDADCCTRPGETGRLLRRETLYTSHLPVWRKTPHNGSPQGLTPKKHGAKPGGPNPLSARVRQLEAKPDIGNTFRERVISGQYETESMAQRKQSGRICRAQLVLSWCLIWKSHAGLVEKGTDPEARAPSCQRDFRGDRFGLYSDEIAPGSHGRR